MLHFLPWFAPVRLALCGGGTATRTVDCVLNGTVSVVDGSKCTTQKPDYQRACNAQACTQVRCTCCLGAALSFV